MCQMMFQLFSQLYRNYFKGSRESKDCEKLEPGEMDKIAVMELKIAQLVDQNKDLQTQLDYNRSKEAALQKVLGNYDNLLKQVLSEKNSRTREQDETSYHLANLETAFYDLLQKYEKAKIVVQGFQSNEAVLKKQVEEYEDILDNLRMRFTTYKSLSENKLEVKHETGLKKNKSAEESKGKKRRLLTTM